MTDVTLTIADATTKADVSPLPSSDIVSRNVYRTTAGGDATTLALLGSIAVASAPAGTQFTFTDHSVAPGSYGYVCTEVTAAGESAKGDLFPVTVDAPSALPNPATILSATKA